MNIRPPHAVVFCLCLIAATAARSAEILPTAKPEEVGLDGKKLDLIVPAVERLVARGSVSGAVTIVARRGKVAHFEATGYRDLASRKPMERDTIFRIFSMTKPVTAVAALILVEEGKLTIDAPVSKYLPAFKDLKVLVDGKRIEPKRAMTVKDLMCHTSGLTYGYFGGSGVDKEFVPSGVLDDKGDLAGMVEKLSRFPLAHHPGERWRYSVSSDVLGRVVEVASGKTLDVFMKERIFDPLGMVDTGFYVPKEKIGRLAVNYGPMLSVVDHPARSRLQRPATLFAGGHGLVSTARDFLRFSQMLLNGGVLGKKRILRAATVKEMTRNHLPKDQVPIRVSGVPLPGQGFGYGLSVKVKNTSFPYPGTVGEFGWAGAASTYFWVMPKDELIGIILTQRMPMAILPVLSVKSLVVGAIEKEKKVEKVPAGAGKKE